MAGIEQQLTNAVAFLPGDSSPELASVQNECLKWEAVTSLPSVLSTQHSDQGIMLASFLKEPSSSPWT